LVRVDSRFYNVFGFAQRRIRKEKGIGKFTMPMCAFDIEPKYKRFLFWGGGRGGIWTGSIEKLQVFPVTTIPAMFHTHPHVNAIYQKDKRTKTGIP
jgi:hypothetical protein